MDDFGLEIEFFFEADERDHDLGFYFDLLLRDIGCGLEDGARLHLGDFRVSDAEPATAVPEHRVEFVELFYAMRERFGADPDFLAERCLRFRIVGQEFVEWRIEETDRGRITFERLENAG